MKKVVLLIIILFPIVAVSQTASECVERGDNYFNGKNGVTQTYYEAVKWYQKAADMGDAKGICSLARMYDYGYGVSKDSEKAEELYLKSAGMGYALAQFYLGDYYEQKESPHNFGTYSQHYFPEPFSGRRNENSYCGKWLGYTPWKSGC